LASYGVRAEAAPVGAGWYLQMPGKQAVSLAPAYRPVSRRLRPAPSMLLRREHGLVPFLGRQLLLDQITGQCQDPATDLLVLLVLLVTGDGAAPSGRSPRPADRRAARWC
jgi:hypothetical protein